ncbi:MAG: aminoacyl-tRNA hydrolase [Proteobacteria bacterium]|nr:aminoacyl-tRNA hydrolase [Pseudomonadota bacterium]
MEEDLRIQDKVIIPGSELRFIASRSGGPGGQHANKTSSRITLIWDVFNTHSVEGVELKRLKRRLSPRITQDGLLKVHVDEERSQYRNREIARERLRDLVQTALLVQKRRVPTRASAAAKQRRVNEKKKRGNLKRQRSDPSDDE